jgi:nitrite reductase/ring-hydroxylating ferredoxin subunit
MKIACPWHGVEFDLVTGICRADPRYRLRSFEVLLEGEDVFLLY